MSRIGTQLKNDGIVPFELQLLHVNQKRNDNKKHTLGAIDPLLSVRNRKRLIIDAVSRFEHYFGYITTLVYKQYLQKLNNTRTNIA
jgi:hypothetical protein